MYLAELIYLVGRFLDDVENIMNREQLIELAAKLHELKKYDEVQPCAFTNYFVACIIERHYKNTDII